MAPGVLCSKRRRDHVCDAGSIHQQAFHFDLRRGGLPFPPCPRRPTPERLFWGVATTVAFWSQNACVEATTGVGSVISCNRGFGEGVFSIVQVYAACACDRRPSRIRSLGPRRRPCLGSGALMMAFAAFFAPWRMVHLPLYVDHAPCGGTRAVRLSMQHQGVGSIYHWTSEWAGGGGGLWWCWTWWSGSLFFCGGTASNFPRIISLHITHFWASFGVAPNSSGIKSVRSEGWRAVVVWLTHAQPANVVAPSDYGQCVGGAAYGPVSHPCASAHGIRARVCTPSPSSGNPRRTAKSPWAMVVHPRDLQGTAFGHSIVGNRPQQRSWDAQFQGPNV